MKKKVLLPLELAGTPNEAARTERIPPLALSSHQFERATAQSARPSYDSLVQREIKSARSSLYSEELENQRLEQQIRYLTERNAELIAEVYRLRQQTNSPYVVEVLPDAKLLEQNLHLEYENDYLRQECQKLYQIAASARQSERVDPPAGQYELEHYYRKTKMQQQELERQAQEIAVLHRLANIEKPCLQPQAHNDAEFDELKERVRVLEGQQRSGAALYRKYAEARAEIRQLRDELETEKGAFLEYVRMQRQDFGGRV